MLLAMPIMKDFRIETNKKIIPSRTGIKPFPAFV
jgi:hypothetical protein